MVIVWNGFAKKKIRMRDRSGKTGRSKATEDLQRIARPERMRRTCPNHLFVKKKDQLYLSFNH